MRRMWNQVSLARNGREHGIENCKGASDTTGREREERRPHPACGRRSSRSLRAGALVGLVLAPASAVAVACSDDDNAVSRPNDGGTRETSFRSPRSLAEQRAAVPGRPGAVPSRAYITLSTCATQEDHAAGNYWADQFDNPEHRIDKIGVLVRTDVVPD